MFKRDSEHVLNFGATVTADWCSILIHFDFLEIILSYRRSVFGLALFRKKIWFTFFLFISIIYIYLFLFIYILIWFLFVFKLDYRILFCFVLFFKWLTYLFIYILFFYNLLWKSTFARWIVFACFTRRNEGNMHTELTELSERVRLPCWDINKS